MESADAGRVWSQLGLSKELRWLKSGAKGERETREERTKTDRLDIKGERGKYIWHGATSLTC